MKYEKKTEHLIQKVSGWRASLLHVCQEISVGLTLMEDNIYWFSSFWDRDIVPVDSQQYTHIISLTCLEAHPPQKSLIITEISSRYRDGGLNYITSPHVAQRNCMPLI